MAKRDKLGHIFTSLDDGATARSGSPAAGKDESDGS
jgi:hypothetical protein